MRIITYTMELSYFSNLLLASFLLFQSTQPVNGGPGEKDNLGPSVKTNAAVSRSTTVQTQTEKLQSTKTTPSITTAGPKNVDTTSTIKSTSEFTSPTVEVTKSATKEPTTTGKIATSTLNEEKGDPITAHELTKAVSTPTLVPDTAANSHIHDGAHVNYGTSQVFVLLVLCALIVVGLAYLFYSRVILQIRKMRGSSTAFKSLVEDDDDTYMRLTAMEPIDTQDELMDDCDSVEILCVSNENDNDCHLRRTNPNDRSNSQNNSKFTGVKLDTTDDDMLLFEI